MADPAPFNLPSLAAYQDAQKANVVKEEGGGFGGMAVSGAYDFARSLGYKTRVEKQLENANQVMADEMSKETDPNPVNARFNTLVRVAKRFNELGYTDMVQQIMPELQGLQKAKLEQNKLVEEADAQKASARFNNAKADVEEATFPMQLRKADADAQAAGLEDKAWWFPQEKTWKAVNAKNAQEVAAAKQAGAFPVAATVQAMDASGLGISGKDRSTEVKDFRAQATASALLANQLAEGITMIDKNPNAGTMPAGLTNWAQTVKQNALAAFAANKVSRPDITKEGMSVDKIVENSLPRADAQLRGLVTAIIYAKAREADPGGRLSNQDVQMWAEQFGQGSPQVMRDTMVRMLMESEMGLGVRAGALAIGDDDSALKTAKDAIAKAKALASPPKVDTPVDVKQLSTEELLKRLNGGQ